MGEQLPSKIPYFYCKPIPTSAKGPYDLDTIANEVANTFANINEASFCCIIWHNAGSSYAHGMLYGKGKYGNINIQSYTGDNAAYRIENGVITKIK